MKYLLSLVVALSLFSITDTGHAAEPASPGRNIGLGVIFGEPTGLTAKFWRDSKTAFDAGIAYSFGSYFLGYGDYLVHFPGVFGKSPPFLSEIAPYVGGGVLILLEAESNGRNRAFFQDDIPFAVGVRVPLGLEWRPKAVPIGVMLELAPGVSVFPSVDGMLGGGVGIRYYL